MTRRRCYWRRSALAAPPPPTATPAPRPAAPKEFMANDNVKTIYFDFDKADIRPGDAKVLDANAAWLKSNLVLVTRLTAIPGSP